MNKQLLALSSIVALVVAAVITFVMVAPSSTEQQVFNKVEYVDPGPDLPEVLAAFKKQIEEQR